MKTIEMVHDGKFTIFSGIVHSDAPVRVRKTWGALRPVTKVKPSAKLYKRVNRVACQHY